MNDAPTASAPAVAARAQGHRVRTALVVILALLVALDAALAAYLFLKPIGLDATAAAPNPTADYAGAMARVTAIEQREAADPTLIPGCRSQLYDQGARTANVIVLFHGYTNCPEQYHLLAQELADDGYTVYVPRMPHHGELDREHTTLGSMTAEELVTYANDAVDIAAGLGDRVTVMGLSGGGTTTAYVGQFRDDVDLAVPIATYLGLPSVPEPLTPALVNLAELLPPIGIGDKASDVVDSGVYAPYAAFDNNTRAAAAYMRVAQVVLADAARTAHAAGQTVLVINEADDTVNLAMLNTLDRRWEALAPATSDTYRFDASLHLPHDLIGPDRVDQRIDVVYPVLLDLLAKFGS